MTMNFFKRVMTFFSTLWNAILWRKTDKKAKQDAKYSKAKALEETREAENDLTTVSETEKLFVDIPLDRPEGLLDKELLITDDIPETLNPIVGHNTESRPAADIGIKKYSSGVQLFGFEEETCKSLSFFSEPLRDDKESETPLLYYKNEHGGLAADESAVSETVLGEEADASEETVGEQKAFDGIIVNQDEANGLQAFEELPTPPTDSISICEDDFYDQRDPPELDFAALEIRSPSDNVSCSTYGETEVTNLNNEILLETQPSLENLSSSTDRITVFRKSIINPDLIYLAIGDEIHLFDHDGAPEKVFEKSEERENNETAQADETCQLVGGDPISTREYSEVLGAALCASEDFQANKNATASSKVVSIGVSVSSTQSTSEVNKQAPDSTISEYSTNYMVKSDSLVNFLPEGGSDLDDVSDIADLLLGTAKKSTIYQKEKEISLVCSSLLKEGEMEEMMCTPRGILKLSGDHNVECIDENDGTIDDQQQSHVKTAVDDFLLDAFAFEEPLMSPHHLEECILEETPLESDNDDSPLFREILKTAGLEDSESVRDLDGTTNDEFDTEPDTIVRCRSIIHDSPKLQIIPSRSQKDIRNESPKSSQDERDEDINSPCSLSQFTTFHLDDESADHFGNLKRNEHLAPGTPIVRYGEFPSRSGPLNLVGSERDNNSSYLGHKGESKSTNLSNIVDSQSNNELLIGPGWRVTLPSLTEATEASETPNHESADCLPFLSKHACPMLSTNDKSCHGISVEKSSQTHTNENISDFYPFIDCSSYLFRIPEEIRKETSFNPCVGAAPSRRSYTNNANFDSTRYINDDEREAFENKYQNMNSSMNSMVPNCVGAVPMVNPCIPEEYRSTRIANIPDGYIQRPVSQNVGPVWGAHPEDQQEAILGYPVSSDGNYYEGEDLNVPAAYENDQSNMCSDSEGYGYINPYGAVEFPLLGIPICTPQSESAFMPRGPLSPIIFPVGPMNVPQNENLPSLVNVEAPPQNERYTIPHDWRGYSANLQNDEEKEITSMVEVRSLAPISGNLSCTGTNDDDDEFDDNPIPDPYFQSLADNNSLHTVKSKADSYSGSLFCESLRSLISHNTENENIYPSFSCSSVQGCCPSAVLQSCETTLSNDSLPSIIVEETNYSKSADEDYLATEKFMNDVNTALNESVLDQIQGRLDLHSNLLGRGDCSLPVGPDERQDHTETPENDVMLRNSLGENISINNSKLTFLDGVLGTDNGGNLPDPLKNLWEIDSESSDSATNYCRGVLDSVVENVIASSVDQSVELQVDIADRDAASREDLGESLLQESPERDLIVQNMMFIEGVPDQVKHIWTEGLAKQTNHDQKQKILHLDQSVKVDDASGVLDEIVEEALENSADTFIGKPQTSAADDIPSRKGRRNRRRRKKLSDVDSEVEPEPFTEVAGSAIGDGISTLQDQLTEPNGNKVEDRPPNPSKPGQNEAHTSKPKADGELFVTENTKEYPKCEQDVVQIEDEGNGHQGEDEEPGENSGNPSNNRRRRNRRRKRKN